MSQQIVRNTGTNNTLYYNVINYFRTIMDNHPSIGATSLGDLWDVGERQFPQYPIANIQILESDFGTSTTSFRVELLVADKVKNKNNESNPTNNEQTIPYYQTDDKVDIYANTLAILNDLTSYTQRGVAGFEINDDITCTPFADRLDNGVAGWTANFTLTTHNDKNRCLFFLINPSGSGYIIQQCDKCNHEVTYCDWCNRSPKLCNDQNCNKYSQKRFDNCDCNSLYCNFCIAKNITRDKITVHLAGG
jgi:hypothetical protein